MQPDDETIDQIIEGVTVDAFGDNAASGGEIRIAHARTSYTTTSKLWRRNRVRSRVRSV